MHSEQKDTFASVTNRLESRIERAKKPVSLEIWTLEPKGEAQCHKLELPSLEALCYNLGPKEFLPFRVDDRGPVVYTYVSVDNERKIIVCQNEFKSDDEFWENYPDGQTLAIPVPLIVARDTPYDYLKSLLRENESGLLDQLRKVRENHCTATRRHKIDRRELQRAKETARYDGLCKESGVYSQGEYKSQKEKHVKLAAQDMSEGLYSAVLFMDMRKFKRINDSCGHQFGDTVLKDVSQTIKSTLRSTDSVYRAGGEEFVAVLHNLTSERAVESIVEKIKESVDSLRLRNPFYDLSALRQNGSKVFESGDEVIRVKINVGYSLFDDRLPEALRGWSSEAYTAAFDAVVHNADVKMYADKVNSCAPSKDTLNHVREFLRLDRLSKTA